MRTIWNYSYVNIRDTSQNPIPRTLPLLTTCMFHFQCLLHCEVLQAKWLFPAERTNSITLCSKLTNSFLCGNCDIRKDVMLPLWTPLARFTCSDWSSFPFLDIDNNLYLWEKSSQVCEGSLQEIKKKQKQLKYVIQYLLPVRNIYVWGCLQIK